MRIFCLPRIYACLYGCLLIGLWSYVHCQTPCDPVFAHIVGSVIDDERGYSLTLSNDQSKLYVAGIRNDSALIIQADLNGQVMWARTFDVVPGQADHIYRILVDSDGMLGVSGIAGDPANGGTVFVFRYDPIRNQILWSEKIISTSTNYNMGMIELGPGGNYLMTNNPTSPNVAELLALDRNDGNLVPGFSKHYDLGSAETFYDMTLYKGDLYLSGRFSDGSLSEMRNTLVRMNPTDGSIVWSKLGHVSASQPARLYGLDLIILEDTIYSIYLGDPAGTSINQTKAFVQKTTLDGQLIWLRQVEFPGQNDWIDEIVTVDQDLVLFGRNRVAPSDILLIRMDRNGKIKWSRKFDFSNNDNGLAVGSAQSQLIASAQSLYFTAFAEDNQADMILVRTDLNGLSGDSCIANTFIDLPVNTINSTVFYNKSFTINSYLPQVIPVSIQPGASTSLRSHTICQHQREIHTTIDTVICQGTSVAGYQESGVYEDTLQTINGCDSIRILQLDVAEPTYQTETVDLCRGIVLGHPEPGTYTDTLVSFAGCDSIRTVTVADGNRYIPNVFTPNGDQINDLFEIKTDAGSDEPVAFFAVFDRSGNMLYSVSEGPVRWNGKDKTGHYCNPGVFAYVLISRCHGSQTIEHGNITLLR